MHINIMKDIYEVLESTWQE